MTLLNISFSRIKKKIKIKKEMKIIKEKKRKENTDVEYYTTYPKNARTLGNPLRGHAITSGSGQGRFR